MDCGSQRSYHTKRVKDKLSLPVTSSQQLSIAAFGSSRGEPQWCETVHVVVHTKTGICQEVELFIVQHICDPLTAQRIKPCSRMYAHLAPLEFAESLNSGCPQVDKLIGPDLYWQIVTSKVIRGQEGPVAVSTTLGWVLSGPAQPTSVLYTYTACG